jgi:hypothetical protein
MCWGSARGRSPFATPHESPRCSGSLGHFELRFEQTGLELLLEPEAFSFDVDCNRMVQKPIENRAGDHVIAEDLAPGAKTLVAGNDDRTSLVATRDQLEEQIGALAIDRQVADLVADQELRLSQQLEPLVELALGQGLAQRGDQRGWSYPVSVDGIGLR